MFSFRKSFRKTNKNNSKSSRIQNSLIKKYDYISKNNRVSYETRAKGDIELEKVREI